MHDIAASARFVAIVLAVGTLAVACTPTTKPKPLAHPATGSLEGGRPRPAPDVDSDPLPTAQAPVADDASFGDELGRDALIAAVLQRNPSVDAARQAWKAAVARPAQVGALEDPMLTYGFAPGSIGSNRVDYGENVELVQRLPWPGKLRLKSEAAAGDADARFQDLEQAKLEIGLKASALFDDYYLVSRAVELNKQHVRLLEELKQAAAAQYAAGTISQDDPIRAEAELAHLAHQDVVLGAERRVIIARLNALLHRPPAAAMPPPPRQLLVAEEAGDLVRTAGEDLASLEELAISRRPEIAVANAEIRTRTAGASLARLDGFPDFGVMGQYNSMWGDEEHRWMAGVEMNLPIWRERIRAAQTEAEALLLAARRRREAIEDEIRSELRQSYERILEAHHVLELFENRLLRAARDQLTVSRAGLESGRGSFMSLIDAERNLRNVELGYEEARTALDKRIAELARQIGCFPADLSRVLDSRSLAATDGGLR
jgi:outer membrane protein TolC